MNIQCDHLTEARRPDVFVSKGERKCSIIDIAVPGGSIREWIRSRSDGPHVYMGTAGSVYFWICYPNIFGIGFRSDPYGSDLGWFPSNNCQFEILWICAALC